MHFGDLKIGELFRFTEDVGYSLGRKFRKVSGRRYEDLPGNRPNGEFYVYSVGTIRVRVQRCRDDATEALAWLYNQYVVDLHGSKTCDCDPSVDINDCAPCRARAVLGLEKGHEEYA